MEDSFIGWLWQEMRWACFVALIVLVIAVVWGAYTVIALHTWDDVIIEAVCCVIGFALGVLGAILFK